jgi:hypothetical protein
MERGTTEATYSGQGAMHPESITFSSHCWHQGAINKNTYHSWMRKSYAKKMQSQKKNKGYLKSYKSMQSPESNHI